MPDVDERVVRGESSRKMVERLSRAKAHACIAALPRSRERVILIASDTTVVIGASRKILGKPRDAADARRMLASISGRTHEVLTSYTVLEWRGGAVLREATRTVSTKVVIRKLSAAEIRAYVATGEPLDKAGSYAAQGIGMAFVTRIAGSYTNVVGLPMTELCATLREEFSVQPEWAQ